MTYTIAMFNNGSAFLGSNDFAFSKMILMVETRNRELSADDSKLRISEVREYNSYDDYASGIEPLRVKETSWTRTQCPMVRESLRMIGREKMEKQIENSRAEKARKAKNKNAAAQTRARMAIVTKN
jgi:hypothetical protein